MLDMETITQGSGSKVLESPDQFLPRYAAALNHSLLLMTADLEGQLRYVSDSIRNILGYEPEAVIGRKFEEFFTQSQINEALRGGCWRRIRLGSMERCSCEVQDHSGTPRRLQMYNAMVGEGESAGLVCLAMVESRPATPGIDPDSEQAKRILKLATQLTDAERAVVELVVDGQMNKTMARQLGVAVRTIEARRARAMAKLEVRSLPELVQVWMFVRSVESSH